jgi:hypothetical protein
MATSTGNHAGNVLPGMESTPVQRTTDNSFVGSHYANLGCSAAQQSLTSDELADEMYKEIMKLSEDDQQEIRREFGKLARPTLLTEDEDLVPDDALCLKRQRALKRRLGPRRDANKIVKIYRDLQRKVLPKAYAEDPSPYHPTHIFYVLH